MADRDPNEEVATGRPSRATVGRGNSLMTIPADGNFAWASPG